MFGRILILSFWVFHWLFVARVSGQQSVLKARAFAMPGTPFFSSFGLGYEHRLNPKVYANFIANRISLDNRNLDGTHKLTLALAPEIRYRQSTPDAKHLKGRWFGIFYEHQWNRIQYTYFDFPDPYPRDERSTASAIGALLGVDLTIYKNFFMEFYAGLKYQKEYFRHFDPSGRKIPETVAEARPRIGLNFCYTLSK